MDHNLFRPQNFEAGKHGVVGDCNGIPMETRYREETPMFAKKILSLAQLVVKEVQFNYRILDYGCGVGRIAKEIINSTNSGVVVGIDESKEMRELAKKDINKSNRFFADSPHDFTKKADEPFDVAYLVYVLQHIPAVVIREALQRIHHHLRDDGFLLYCSSDYRMAIRFDGKGFCDDRFLGVNLQEELSRYFDLVGPAFTDEELERNPVTRTMIRGEGGLAHPALVFRKKKIDGPLFNAQLNGQVLTTKNYEPGPATAEKRMIDTRKKLVLIQKQSPGDIMMATIALRDLHKTYPGEYITDMRTPCNDIFKNNPYVESIVPAHTKEKEIIERLKADDQHPPVKMDMIMYSNLHYPMIHQSGVLGAHFADSMTPFLAEQLGRPIKRHGLRPELYLDQNEANWPSPVIAKRGYEGKFWVINAGSKSDFPLKQYHRYQEVVDSLKDRITFVQIGVKTHTHAPLEGVIDMVGETNLRELMRVIYKAEGLLTCVSVPMHIAAAFKKPCVVVAGGREGTRWELYPDQRFIYVNGALDCCQYDGCWRSTIGQCAHNENGIPKCMSIISPDEVAAGIMRYYYGGVLEL